MNADNIFSAAIDVTRVSAERQAHWTNAVETYLRKHRGTAELSLRKMMVDEPERGVRNLLTTRCFDTWRF